MAATTTSTSCMSHFNLRPNPVDPRPVRTTSSTSQGSPGCGKVDGVAMWFINGVASAFFASLERCSCLRIATVDDISEDANDLPLIYNDGNYMQELGGKTRRRRAWKAKKSGAYVED